MNIIYIMGKSSSGKDTIFNIIKNKLEVNTYVMYTTRPIREGEIPGETYNYITDDEMQKYINGKEKDKLIEYRTYQTIHGPWTYATIADKQFDTKKDLIMLGTLESYNKMKEYFKKEYDFEGNAIQLNNRYQKTINSYIYNDQKNPTFIHIDELFESTVISFFVAMFKWSKEFDNLDIYGDCFRYTLFLMNDVCIFGEMQALDANNALLHLLNGDMQIMKLAEDCYWTIVVFSMAHEIAHAYLAHIGKKYSERHLEKEEYDADAIAYDIVLKIIMKESNEEPILEKYTYLAPAMYMDFFDLYYYTDRVLYKTMLSDSEHPNPVKRKGKLFAIVDRDEYDFDTIDGNHLYGGFLDVYDEYRDQVFLKKEKGKLDKIIHTERRNRMRR